MILLPSFPLNMAAWFYGGIMLLLFTLKSFRTHQKGGNLLNLHFSRFMLFVGIGLMLYAGAPLLTDNTSVLVVTMSLADSIIMLSMIFQAKVCQALRIFSDLVFRIVAFGIGAISLGSLYLGISYTQIKFEPFVISHIMHPLNGWLQSLVFIAVLVPTGYFFIKSGLKQTGLLTVFKVTGFGTAYLLSSLVSVINYGVLHGQDSIPSAIATGITFTILFLIIILPSKVESTVFQRVTNSPPLRRT